MLALCVALCMAMSAAATSVPLYFSGVRNSRVPSLRRELTTDIPAGGNTTLGYYYALAMVGTPALPQSVILDTGSSLMSVACAQCSACE